MIFVDTSAAVTILQREPQGESVKTYWCSGERLVGSVLLDLELARVSQRLVASPEKQTAALQKVDDLLSTVNLVAITAAVVERSKSLTGELRSLDAIHLATALLLDSNEDPIKVLTLDTRLARASREHGLRVVP